MKLEEAIELLDIAKEGFPANDTEKYYKAMELLIEAGKREKSNRDNPDFIIVGPLPGETEE